MTRRDPVFDVAKALAMMLVAWGHTRWAYGCQSGNPGIDNFIVGMNMPVFFVISGYFSARMVESGEWRSLARHLVGYFWPVAVVSCAFAALTVGCGIGTGTDWGFVGYAGRNFLFSPWYLWCLADCLVLTFLSSRIPRVPTLLVLSFLYCLLPFVTGVWYVGTVRAMLPHFAVGLFVLRKWPIWKRRPWGLPCLAIYLFIVLSSGSFRSNGLSFYNGATGWSDFTTSPFNIVLHLARVLLGFIGTIGVLWGVQCFVQRFTRAASVLSSFGTTTLGVYILHQWILAHCVEHLPVGSSFMATASFSVFLFVACHVITNALRSTSWLRKAVWGLWWER